MVTDLEDLTLLILQPGQWIQSQASSTASHSETQLLVIAPSPSRFFNRFHQQHMNEFNASFILAN